MKLNSTHRIVHVPGSVDLRAAPSSTQETQPLSVDSLAGLVTGPSALSTSIKLIAKQSQVVVLTSVLFLILHIIRISTYHM